MARAPRRRTVGAALALLTSLVLAGCAMIGTGSLRDRDHPLAGKIWDPVGAVHVDHTELHRRLAAARVVFLGETHDNPEHHAVQGDILRHLANATEKPVLLMEQFDRDQQPEIDAALASGRDPADLLRGWDAGHYRPLLDRARAAGLGLRAANLPRASLRPVVREGFASLPPGEAERLALDAAWDDARQRYLSEVIEVSHCGKISPTLREGLVRAQRLRDATLADTVLEASGRTVVFVLGRGHARRDVGVPRYLDIRQPGTPMLSIGLVEVVPGKTDPAAYERDHVGGRAAFDLLVFTARAERPDPCLAFGK